MGGVTRIKSNGNLHTQVVHEIFRLDGNCINRSFAPLSELPATHKDNATGANSIEIYYPIILCSTMFPLIIDRYYFEYGIILISVILADVLVYIPAVFLYFRRGGGITEKKVILQLPVNVPFSNYF